MHPVHKQLRKRLACPVASDVVYLESFFMNKYPEFRHVTQVCAFVLVGYF